MCFQKTVLLEENHFFFLGSLFQYSFYILLRVAIRSIATFPSQYVFSFYSIQKIFFHLFHWDILTICVIILLSQKLLSFPLISFIDTICTHSVYVYCLLLHFLLIYLMAVQTPTTFDCLYIYPLLDTFPILQFHFLLSISSLPFLVISQILFDHLYSMNVILCYKLNETYIFSWRLQFIPLH